MPKKRERAKKLKITTTPSPTTMDILDSLASAEQKNPHEVLKNYTQTHFHKHSLYGILQKSKNPPPGLGYKSNEFKLFLYKKPIRNDTEAHATDTMLTIDSKDEVLIASGQDLEKLILLKLDAAQRMQSVIHFNHSLKRKKIVPSLMVNPYEHDHFIYISFVETKKAAECFAGFKKDLEKIKKQFQKQAAYTVDFILLNEEKTIMRTLDEKLAKDKIKEKLKKRKFYIIVDAHSTAGSAELSGEHPDESQWTLTLDQLAEIIKKFEIPKDAQVDIDIFACEPGEYLGDEPAFCQRLKDKIQGDFMNLSIRGNIHTTYSDPDVVLSESPRDVSVFGKLREPLSSKVQLMHSEVYYRIAHLPIEKDKKSARNDLIVTFKKFAEELAQANDEKMSYDAMHLLSTNKWNNFERLDNTIQKAKVDFDQFITSHKVDHPKAYDQLQASFLKTIDSSYQRAISGFRFRESRNYFIKTNEEYHVKLTRITEIYDLKKQLSLNPKKSLFFKGKLNRQVLSIIAQAEKEEITFEDAFDRIFGPMTEEQKLSSLGTVPKVKIT